MYTKQEIINDGMNAENNRSKYGSYDWSIEYNNCNLSEFSKMMLNLNPQKYGIEMQKYIVFHLNGTNNNASNENGDASLEDGKKIETKFSLLTRTNNTLNAVQIRPNHKVDLYLLFGIDVIYDKIFALCLTAEQMKRQKLSSAHGKKETAVEKAWRPTREELPELCQLYPLPQEYKDILRNIL